MVQVLQLERRAARRGGLQRVRRRIHLPRHPGQHMLATFLTKVFLCQLFSQRDHWVLQAKFQDGTKPLDRCYSGKAKQNVRGLCVLPPVDVEMNRNYRTSPCPASCVSYFDRYFAQELCFNTTLPDSVASAPCPRNFSGTMYRQCGLEGRWISKPDVQ